MKRIWTLAACTLMAASLTFAQDGYGDDYGDDYPEESTESVEQQEESAEPAAEQAEDQPAAQVAEEENSSSIQQSNQVSNQAHIEGNGNVVIQNNYYTQATAQSNEYAKAEEPQEPAESSEESAQRVQRFGFGIRGAFDYGYMFGFTEDLENDSDIDGNPSGIGFEAGVALRIQMVNNLFFAPEINFAYVSTTHKYLEHDRTYKSSELEIPLLLRGVVAGKFYVTAGPQINIGLNNETDIDPITNKTLDITVQSKEEVEQSNFAFGLAAGAGFNVFAGLFIDLRFYMGLTELFPDVVTLDDVESANEGYSLVDMAGAKMMKLKVGLSYFIM